MASPLTSQHTYRQLLQHFPAQYFDEKLLNDYLNSQHLSFGKPVNTLPSSFMTSSYPEHANPAIRLHQSESAPQAQQSGFSCQSMLSTSRNGGLDSWQSHDNMQVQSLQTPARNSIMGHQRESSSSSVGSSTSQYRLVGSLPHHQYVTQSVTF